MPLGYTTKGKSCSTTLLYLAVCCGDTRMMEYFIELGADLNVLAHDPDGALGTSAPLHKAVYKGVSPISHCSVT